MALKKQIELQNGITVDYHRIVSINKITNKTIIIEIASYISEEKRLEEIQKDGQEMNIFIKSTFFNKEYNETDTIEDLYEYLKTTPLFEGAENI